MEALPMQRSWTNQDTYGLGMGTTNRGSSTWQQLNVDLRTYGSRAVYLAVREGF